MQSQALMALQGIQTQPSGNQGEEIVPASDRKAVHMCDSAPMRDDTPESPMALAMIISLLKLKISHGAFRQPKIPIT